MNGLRLRCCAWASPAGSLLGITRAAATACGRDSCGGGAFSMGVLGKWLRRSALRVHAKALLRLPLRKRNSLKPCGLRVRAGFPAAAAAHPQFVQVFVNSFVSTADWQYPLKKANSALSPTFFSISYPCRLGTPLYSHFLRSQEKMTCFATDVKLCSYRVDLCNRLTISRQY